MNSCQFFAVALVRNFDLFQFLTESDNLLSDKGSGVGAFGVFVRAAADDNVAVSRGIAAEQGRKAGSRACGSENNR